MKLRNGKYTSKDDIVEFLEEQKAHELKICITSAEHFDVDDVIFVPSSEVKLEFIMLTFSILWIMVAYMLFVC